MTNEQQILIDRMVDGELDAERQRELLLACEQRESWRELALAYVESQALGTELTSLMEETTTADQSVASRGRNSRTRSDWRPLSLAAAILFSLSVGYGLGWVVQDVQPSMPGGMVVQSPSAESQLSSMRLTVSDPATSGLRQVELPLVNASDLGPDWLQQLELGLPDDYVQEIRGRGLDIRRTRTLTPVKLGDGRFVVVPIDYYTEQKYQ